MFPRKCAEAARGRENADLGKELSTKIVDNLLRSGAAAGKDAREGRNAQENRKSNPSTPAQIVFVQHIKHAHDRAKKQAVDFSGAEFGAQIASQSAANRDG